MQNCKEAVKRIALVPGIQLTEASSFYSSEPVGIENQNWFVNAVVEIRTSLSALGLLHVLQDIENAMGRKELLREDPGLLILIFFFMDKM